MANHEYEGNEIDRDEKLTKQLANNDIEFIRHHDQCILPPLSITTNDGDSMYKVFTPFYRKWRDTLEAGSLSAHEATKVTANNKTKARIKSMALKSATDNANTSASIEKLAHKIVADYQKPLEYDEKKFTDKPAQLKQAREDYPAGEDAAIQRLKEFVAEDIEDYDVSRDKPILQGTSQLSAYLTIGAISPRLCYLQAAQAQEKLHGNDSDNEDINRWISELAWRDFYRHVLVDKPKLIEHKAYKEDADNKVNWSYDKDDFAAWCAGKTGVPLVDAAMRCLNATGFMHNRLRMVTAMFLTKDLLIDWRWGERYFMQQLIDGDFASNNGGWQWSASTGTDSAPYFRIMNPFSQGKSHDAKGEFIKTWLPELKDVPVSTLHSEDTMRKALKKGGEFADIDYPVPMVEHKKVRKLAIAEFKK
jgi:deoxyribodipyrimidine photo-lyase